MKKILLILTLLVMVLVNPVYAAMDPAPAFCQHMGYKMIGYSIGEYGTETIERFDFYYEGKTPEYEFQYKGIKYTNLRDIEGIKRQDIKWAPHQYYCLFDDGNKCYMGDFYDGKCGAKYVKTFPCRTQNKPVFHFEKCCKGLSSYLPYMMVGQSTCQPISKVIISWISALPILLFFSPIGWLVLSIIGIILIVFIIKRIKRKR